jgi:hypothetical protein
MKLEQSSDNQERKEDTRLEKYRVAIKDARHIFNTYRSTHPDDAWECLRKIIFNKDLR